MKKFNLFKLSLLLLMVVCSNTQAWAWSINYARIYYDNSVTNWSDTYVQLFIDIDDGGNSDAMSMGRVAHTKLFYKDVQEWMKGGDYYHGIRFAQTASGDWGWEKNSSWTRVGEAYCSGRYGSDTNLGNHTHLFANNSTTAGANISRPRNGSNATMLNHDVTVGVMTKVGDDDYSSDVPSVATISMQHYTFNSTTYDAVQDYYDSDVPTLDKGATVTYKIYPAYTSDVTYSYSDLEPGYEFIGWYDEDGNLLSENDEYTLNTTENYEIYAYFAQAYAYVEGRFRVYNEARNAITTTYSSGGNWNDDSRNIEMTFNNGRYELHTYMTLEELSENHGTGCQDCKPYFYIKTSSSNSALSDITAYRPSSSATLVDATEGEGVEVTSSASYNTIYFNNSSEAGYVVLYFDQSKVWYELEPATFTAATDADWNDASNWSPAKVPNSETDVVLTKPVEVDMAHAQAKSIQIYNNGSTKTGKLTVLANMGLEVEGTITKTTNGSSYGPTAASDIILESDDTGNATLIFNNSNSCQATVYMYSKGWTDGVEDTGDWNWQYIGVPVTDATRLNDYYGGYMYEWNTSGKKWDDVTNTSATLTTFKAYSVTYPTTEDDLHTYEIDGTLAATSDQSISVTAGITVQAAANSWTAPIRINNITYTNWSPATIFLFNTGYGTATKATEVGQRYSPNTYLPIPVLSAPYLGESYIAPMQGFLFKNTKSAYAGTITLSYANAVRTDGSEGIVAGPMHAPQRLAEEKPVVLKIYVSGTENDDRVVLLERSDFSRDFDNGWDGEKFQVNAVKTAPRLFAINETGGKEAVSAIPEFEGTVIGFRPGTDDNYKISFEYSGNETLYLKDTKNDALTLIDNESEYNFTSNGENEDSRFLIYKAPAITTGTDHIGDGNSIRKQMINGQLYIIRDGQIYDMLGKTIQ